MGTYKLRWKCLPKVFSLEMMSLRGAMLICSRVEGHQKQNMSASVSYGHMNREPFLKWVVDRQLPTDVHLLHQSKRNPIFSHPKYLDG